MPEPNGGSSQLSLFAISERELLLRLRALGASRLERVAYRRNRSTLWSLTRNGSALNVHEAYRFAPDEVVVAFARIATAQRVSPSYRAAVRTVGQWSGVHEALRSEVQRRRRAGAATARRAVKCAGTAAEQQRLRSLYIRFNHERFGDALPAKLTLRLSSRMRSRLGHIVPVETEGARVVEELAINRRLMRDGNERELHETLLHEMAHVAAYLFEGDAGHGSAWKRWAVRVGCRPRACASLRLS